MFYRSFLMIFVCFATILNQASALEEFQDGVHYETLEKPVLSDDPSKIEVLELFWYGCPHCDDLDPSLKVWVSKLPSDVSFSRLPVVFGKSWEMHARMFWAAKNLNVLETVHQSLFNALHRESQKLQSESDVVAFFERFGLDPEVVRRELYSFSTENALRLSDARARAYGIRGVPALVVNGRYVTGVSQAGGEQKLFKLLNQLLEISRQ